MISPLAPRTNVGRRSAIARRLQEAVVAARQGLRSADPLVLVGLASLAAALVLTVTTPPTLLRPVLGFVAVIGLSRSRKLGPIAAGLLVCVAIPFGRAADNELAAVAGLPLRFHDGVILATGLLVLPSLRRATIRPALVPITGLWLAVGLVALVIGMTDGQAQRDILRDARWWALYGFVPFVLWTGTTRSTILRALLAGATIYAVLLLVTAVLPAFDGGLKDRAITYDRGLLRLQFSNNTFVIVAAAWILHRLLGAPSWARAAWFALLGGGIALSLTRMSIFALAGVVGLSVLLFVGGQLFARRADRSIRRAVVVGGFLAVAVAAVLGGLVVSAVSVGGDDALARLFFQAPNSGLDAIARGRGATYAAAQELIAEQPLRGHGLGTLVPYTFTPGGARPSTLGMQPAVDNAYMTVAMKAGIVGAAAFVLLVGWPLVEVVRRPRDRDRRWFGIAWLAVLGLTVTQSYASGGYGPFALAALIAFMSLGRRPSTLTARAERPASPG
jgi:O-antigen ligase